MGVFPAAKAHFQHNFVALVEEFEGLSLAGVEVVLADAEGQSDAFQVDFLLVSLGFAFFLFLLEGEGTEVEDFADRWLSHRRDFNQIKPSGLGHGERLTGVEDAEGFTGFIDHGHLRNADEVIDPKTFNCDSRLITNKRLQYSGNGGKGQI